MPVPEALAAVVALVALGVAASVVVAASAAEVALAVDSEAASEVVLEVALAVVSTMCQLALQTHSPTLQLLGEKRARSSMSAM